MSGPIHDRDPLSRSARDLIASARDGDAPRPEDRVRVRRALAVAIAASAGTAGASVSAAAGAKAIAASTASSAGGGSAAVAGGAVTAGLFTKVAIVVVAIGVSSGAIVAVNRYTSAPTTSATATDDDPHTRTSRAPERGALEPSVDVRAGAVQPVEPDAVEPDAVEPDAVEPATVADATTGAAPTPLAARRPRATPRPIAAPAAGDLSSPELSSHEAELHVLRDAAAHGRSPAQRLVSVDLHASQFPDSDLAGERERARQRAVHDLCAEGPDAVAAYLAADPTSSSARLLHSTCPAVRR